MENRNNNPIAEEIIHNNPTGYGLFAGIGDNFNSAAQATRTCIFCHNRPEISNVTKTATGHRNIPIPVPLFNHLKEI